LALEQLSLAWSHGRHAVGCQAQAGELGDLKAAFPWVAEAPHHCLQQTLRDLEQAFQHFFAGRTAYRVFRKKFQKDSFHFPDGKQFEVDEAGQRMKLSKFGWPSSWTGCAWAAAGAPSGPSRGCSPCSSRTPWGSWNAARRPGRG
jgi:hypothetical protein